MTETDHRAGRQKAHAASHKIAEGFGALPADFLGEGAAFSHGSGRYCALTEFPGRQAGRLLRKTPLVFPLTTTTGKTGEWKHYRPDRSAAQENTPSRKPLRTIQQHMANTAQINKGAFYISASLSHCKWEWKHTWNDTVSIFFYSLGFFQVQFGHTGPFLTSSEYLQNKVNSSTWGYVSAWLFHGRAYFWLVVESQLKKSR